MKVDKDIPMPLTRQGKWSLLKNVGDSVFIEDRDEKTRHVVSANQWGKHQKPPRKFRAWYVTGGGGFVSDIRLSDGIVGVRLWRVE
jgi:hypothetical protein